jgi:hypothetical protein
MRPVSSAYRTPGPAEDLPVPTVLPETAQEAVAWEMIEAGRYRPRRIRGSFRGRELG